MSGVAPADVKIMIAAERERRLASEWLKELVEEFHRPLTARQLDNIEQAFEASRKRQRSKDRSLPPGAGRRLRQALPSLLKECDREALADPQFQCRLIADDLAEADRKLEAVASALQGVVSLRTPTLFPGHASPDAVSDDARQFTYRWALTVVNDHRKSVDLLRRLALLFFQPPGRGRKVALWRSIMLRRLAACWFRQGWKPTQQPGGCFLTVASLLRDARTAGKFKDKDWNPLTVRQCIQAGLRQCEQEVRSTTK